MANGDAAAAAGLPVIPATKDIRLGYDDVNKLADSVAGHLVSGGHAFGKISGQATTAQITDKAVTTAKLADLAVTTAKIAAGAVGKAQVTAPVADTTFGSSASGWSSSGLTSVVYTQGYMVNVALRLQRLGGPITPNASGGITDTLMFTVSSSAYIPNREVHTMARYGASGGGTYGCLVSLGVDGKVYVRALAPNASLVNTAAGVAAIMCDFVFINP